MKPRTLATLVVLGALALAAGWYFGIAQEPQAESTTDNGRLMFRELPAHLGDATQVELVHGANTVRIVRDAATQTWGLAQRDGYPVDVGKLRALLTGLTELRLVERRTADPAELGKLGLDDPAGKDASATLIRVTDAAGQPIAALVAGHSRMRTGGTLPDEIYVRRPDENQSWLAEGKLDVDSDPLTWLDRDIMDIAPARVASVGITSGTTLLKLVKNGDKLTMQTPADHPPLDDGHLDDVTHALELLSLQDVRKDANAPAGDALGTSVFTTDDGLAITATPSKADGDLWVRFAVAATDDKANVGAKAEAQGLTERLAGWTYQIGGWKLKALIPTLDDLKAPPPPAPPKSISTPAAPSPPAPAKP